MPNKLENLKKLTTVVSDTGDINAIKQYTPIDATTNPSLIYQAAELPQYEFLVTASINWAKKTAASSEEAKHLVIDRLTVDFGKEILKIVPGRVSTEVDARLSFDTQKSIDKAHYLIGLYEEAGIDRKRILIKLASTWEGIEAAKVLEKEGIHCNMTLMFSLVQAVAAANAGATLISPFVGRILDWHLKQEGKTAINAVDDPGVHSVETIYNYYKYFDYKTQVMGASFRNTGEILELAGCDLLTIAPKFLEELQKTEGDVPSKLSLAAAKKTAPQKLSFNEGEFRFLFNDDAMATEKLAEGIRHFAKDLVKLEDFIATKF